MNNDPKIFHKLTRSSLAITIIAVLIYAGLAPVTAVQAANPASGTISVNGPSVQWDGTMLGTPPAANGEGDCTVVNPAFPTTGNCDDFTLTISGNPGDWAGKLIRVRFTWTSPSTDYDMAIRRESNGTPGLQGDGACAGAGQTSTCDPGPGGYDELVGSSGNGATTYEEAVLNPSATGTGDYYVRSIYFAPNAADQYHATVTVFNAPPPLGSPVAAVAPTFDDYQPPALLNGSPYPRRDDSGEPSIGINWNSNNVMTMSRLQCNRTTFSDAHSPSDPNNDVTWFPKNVSTDAVGLDPILYTDPTTGRTICGELQGAGGATNGIMSDDDLTTTSTTFQTGGPTQGIDHQSIGGGPPNPNVANRQPTGAYPHLFYYASQQTAYASVATSFDGGLTYGPAVPMYTLADCTNLHGHIRVSPQGTVYVPNRSCGGHAAVIVSEDNGLNWSVRPQPNSSAGRSDPSVGIGAGGRLYLGYTDSSQHPHVAISDDHGLTWLNDFSLDAVTSFPASTGGLPFRAAAFPQVIAGDNNRAAVFFIATNSNDQQGNGPTGDDNGGNGPNFKGTWYPFIGITVDGGVSWTVSRADNDPLNPGALNPVQQGVVCLSGTVCPGGPPDTRNLLDFCEINVDSAGRIYAVYADGCNFDHSCININDNSGDRVSNQGTARLTIIRQRGGSRLFRAFDPPPGPPQSPFVNATPAQKGIQVQWAAPDDRGAPIREYRVYRGSPNKPERLVTTVKPTTNVLVDKQGKEGDYYHVTAVNKYGESAKPAKTFVKRKKRSAR